MNGAFVLDCSVTMAWFFADEATPGTDALLDHLGSGGHAMVPRHWFLEVGNTLLMGERRKRCSEADAASFLGILRALAIEPDPDPMAPVAASALALARGHGLTLYDAAYLDLAMRSSRPLATLDKELRSAARKAGVKCLPERI
jgi:predicted nucleic acid-binding protein